MIDSHCHIGFEELKENVGDIIARAETAGVEKMLTVACNREQLEELIPLLDMYPQVFGAFGVHPHEAQEQFSIQELTGLLTRHPKIIGVGETGLDYHYDYAPREDQRQSFHTHIQAAIMLHMPLIIHTREAEVDTIDILRSEQKNGGLDMGGVIHCFTGSQALANAALDMGFYISASGVITFAKALDLRDIFTTVPLNRLLIETDSPYLAPIPYRGKQNEPSFLPKTAEVLANIKGVSVKELTEITTKNFNKLFNIGV